METLNKIQQQLKAPKGQHNTFGNYNYRSCEDILEAVKPLLGKATITINDEVVVIGTQVGTPVNFKNKKGEIETEVIGGERYYIKATVTITEGDKSISVSAYARESFAKPGMDSAQITGAASSYARKYLSLIHI